MVEILDPFESVDAACAAIRQGLSAAKNITLRLRGASMSGAINDQDLAVVEKVCPHDLKEGDILLVRTPDGRLIAHRLIARRKKRGATLFFTKGDQARAFDRAVEFASIVGTVRRVIRNGKPVEINQGWARRMAKYWNVFFPDAAIAATGLTRMACCLRDKIFFRQAPSGAALESRLLALVLCAGSDRTRLAQLEQFDRSAVDWECFLRKACEHKVAALLYKISDEHAQIAGFLPVDVIDRCRQIYYATLRRNVLIGRTFESVGMALAQADIRFVVLKGLWLGEQVYGDIGVRPLSDIDILVDKDDVMRLDLVFRKLGYTCGVGGDVASVLRAPTRQRHSLLYYRHEPDTVYWHVCWHLFNFYPGDQRLLDRFCPSEVWQEACQSTVGKVPVLALSCEHQLIFLSMHALSHSYTPLLLLCDIRMFLERYGHRFAWEKLIRQAQEYRVSRFVYYALLVARQTVGAVVPDKALEALRPDCLSRLERAILDSVVSLGPAPQDQALVLALAGLPKRAQIAAMVRMLFPSVGDLALIRQKPGYTISLLDYGLRLLKAARYAFSLRKTLLTH